jgi:DNA polymerase-3 subunit epsilon
MQGMRVALAAEVERTHEELVERILHAGLAYAEAVDQETSLVICNEHRPARGKGYLAHELGVPLVPDAAFMDHVRTVVGGSGLDGVVPAGEQFALF